MFVRQVWGGKGVRRKSPPLTRKEFSGNSQKMGGRGNLIWVMNSASVVKEKTGMYCRSLLVFRSKKRGGSQASAGPQSSWGEVKSLEEKRKAQRAKHWACLFRIKNHLRGAELRGG